jgi:hypothetical protein
MLAMITDAFLRLPGLAEEGDHDLRHHDDLQAEGLGQGA